MSTKNIHQLKKTFTRRTNLLPTVKNVHAWAIKNNHDLDPIVWGDARKREFWEMVVDLLTRSSGVSQSIHTVKPKDTNQKVKAMLPEPYRVDFIRLALKMGIAYYMNPEATIKLQTHIKETADRQGISVTTVIERFYKKAVFHGAIEDL